VFKSSTSGLLRTSALSWLQVKIKRSWTNGAGRTILLRALLRLVPYSGEISGVPDVRIGYVPHRNSKLIDTSL
jgi:ATPase subunit of ABC transporter with duplicated ATPase domains